MLPPPAAAAVPDTADAAPAADDSGSAAAGEDVLAREQAIEATALWAVGDWDGAQQTLQRLDATLPSDPRVQLNLQVAGYHADAGSGRSLNDLAAQLDTWLACHTFSAEERHNGYATAAINFGVIMFLQQQHARALAVLEPLFEQAELLPDGSTLCLCALLLEIYLDSMQLPKSVQVLHYLAAATAPLTPPPAAAALAADADGGSSSSGGARSPSRAQVPSSPSQQQQLPKSPGRPQQQEQQQQQHGEGAASNPACMQFPIASRLMSAEMQQVQQLVQQQGGELPQPDAAALLHLYKARLALACNSHKAARKELRALLAAHPDSPAAVLLKGQLEVMRQQPKKALKTVAPLLAAASQATVRSRLQLLNLVAALHHQLGKHNVAALYLATALAQHQQVQEQQQQHASPQQAPDGSNAAQQTRWLLPDASDALSFNLGLQQLALHDWQAALHYFEAASGKYFTQPQLWLRLAEACLGLYRTQQQQQQHQQQQQPGSRDDQRQQECAFLLQQAAAHLDTGLTLLQGQQEAASKQLEAAAAATAAAIAAGESPPLLDGPPWLAAAAAAAAAAAHSGGVLGQPGTPVGLSVADTGDTAGSSSAAAAAAALLSSLPPGETLEPRMAAVKQSLLANQAFAALELEQPQQALAAAQALLGCSSMSPHLHYLGSSYAAEALCLLERPQEAAHVLQDHLSLFSGHEAAASGGDERLAAAAASIKSDDDGSCKSCSRGTCMHSSCAAGHGYSHHGHSLQPGAHAAMLHNLSAVMQLMALQGNAAAGVGGPLGPQHQL